jgi:hypothetical protein
MSVFVKPSNGKMKTLGNDSLQFESYPMDKIYSPYEGRVVSTSQSSCGGNIVIEHNFKGSIVISNICEAATILVSRGDKVSSGQVVGRLGGNILEYSLEDSRGNKLNPKSFFGVSGDDSKSKEKEKEKTKSKEKNKKDNSDGKESDDFKVTPGLTIAHQVFADMLAAPLKVFKGKKMFTPGKLFKGKKTESISNQGKLMEEIQRIKSLLK